MRVKAHSHRDLRQHLEEQKRIFAEIISEELQKCLGPGYEDQRITDLIEDHCYLPGPAMKAVAASYEMEMLGLPFRSPQPPWIIRVADGELQFHVERLRNFLSVPSAHFPEIYYALFILRDKIKREYSFAVEQEDKELLGLELTQLKRDIGLAAQGDPEAFLSAHVIASQLGSEPELYDNSDDDNHPPFSQLAEYIEACLRARQLLA